MERILETGGIEARAYKWEQLKYKVGLEYSCHTIRKAMGSMEYHTCIACPRGWATKNFKRDF